MRIGAGKYRGKNLFSFEQQGVRPTSDRAREAIFNILRSRLGDFSGRCFVDAFAGTGAMGLEALSQGFSDVVFCDTNLKLVEKNLRLFENEKNNISLVVSDILRIKKLPKPADVLFLDAPYLQNLSQGALNNLAKIGGINFGAICIVEVAKDEDFVLPEDFDLIDERRYGAAKIIVAHYLNG